MLCKTNACNKKVRGPRGLLFCLATPLPNHSPPPAKPKKPKLKLKGFSFPRAPSNANKNEMQLLYRKNPT